MTDSVLVNNNVQNAVTVDKTDSVAVESTSSDTVISSGSSSAVTNSEIYNVLVSTDTPDVITSGQPGPQGPTGLSEDSVAYARQTDFATESLIYKGEADAGTALSAPLWRIRKIILSEDGDVSETWADGNTNFDNIWDNRASLNYV